MDAMTRRQALAAGAGVLALLAGCSGSSRSLPHRPTGTWRHRARDARNSGWAPAAVPPAAYPAWDAGEAHIAAPLIAGGTVYSASHDVTALDAKTGQVTWEADPGGKVDHAPALLDEVLVVAAEGRVVGLEPSSGDEVWSRSLAGIATGPVTASTEPAVATVPVEDQHLLALDPRTGDERWRDATVGARQAAIADGTAYVAGYRSDGDTGVLRALDAADGTRLWAAGLDHPDAAPVVAEAGLLVADGGTLAVHDPASGDRRRELGTFGDVLDAPPAVADGTAYVAGDDGLVAVSVADGAVEWQADVQVTADTGVTVGREAVVAPVTDLPGVIAFERADGSRRWEHAIDGFDAAASTPAVLADGAAFYASNESVGVVALGDLPALTE